MFISPSLKLCLLYLEAEVRVKKVLDLQERQSKGVYNIIFRGILNWLLLLSILLSANVFSQDQVSDNQDVTSSPELAESAAASELVSADGNTQQAMNIYRDPFRMTGSTERQIDSVMDNSQKSLTQFRLSLRGQTLPRLTLRGVVLNSDLASPLALLEIAGHGVFMVREDDEISYNAASPKDVVKIKRIKRLSVIVEAGTLGDLIVVR